MLTSFSGSNFIHIFCGNGLMSPFIDPDLCRLVVPPRHSELILQNNAQNTHHLVLKLRFMVKQDMM